MTTRGVRGAITVKENNAFDIGIATKNLLLEIQSKNGMRTCDIASAWFTTTEDINAAFPAAIARELPGWPDVPLMCSHEMKVPDSLPMCLRVLIHWHTDKTQKDIKHIYLEGAVTLRPELKN